MAPAKRKAAAPRKPAGDRAASSKAVSEAVSEAAAAAAAVEAACLPQDATRLQRDQAITDILSTHIAGSGFSGASIRALERAQYLERCLWPYFLQTTSTDEQHTATPTHVLSLLVMLNAKHQQRVLDAAWRTMEGAAAGRLVDAAVDLLVNHVLPSAPLKTVAALCVGPVDGSSARSIAVHFLDACFGSLEVPGVRDACLRLVAPGLWTHVEGRRLVDAEYARQPALCRLAKHAARRTVAGKHADAETARRNCRDRDFLWLLVCDFIALLWHSDGSSNDGGSGDGDAAACAYACTFLAFLVTLTSQLATRRFVALLLRDMHVVELCMQAPWSQQTSEDARGPRRFRGLAERLHERLSFPVDDVGGQALGAEESMRRQDARLAALQLAAFEAHPGELDALVNDSGMRLADPAVLAGHLDALPLDALRDLARSVGVRTRLAWQPAHEDGGWLSAVAANIPVASGDDMAYTRAFLAAVFCRHYARAGSEEDGAGAAVLPDEQLLLSGAVAEADTSMRTLSRSAAAAPGFAEYAALPLVLPRMGLQYLTLGDYVQRSRALMQVEAAFAVHEDMKDAVRRLQPADDEGAVVFEGWARMALPLHGPLHVTEVRPPRVGERAPRLVRAELAVDLAQYAESVRREWDADVRGRDTLFLLHVVAPAAAAAETLGVAAVRVCQVEARAEDASGAGVRRLRVLLDPAQYQADVERHAAGDAYAAFNVVLRRRPQEGGVRGVLDALRAMAAVPPQLPAWLAPIFLGYGDPAQATALHVLGADMRSPAAPVAVDFGDTFVSEEHLRSSFAETHADIALDPGGGGGGAFATPCVVEFCGGGRLRVSSRKAAARGPMALQAGRANTLAFTPAQVRALLSASLPGLTLIVGPPGTGKTDVAVQAVANLYHAHAAQTTLLLTHSNQALNQLFAKIVAAGNIEPRHLLRLGHGEEDLDAAAAAARYSKAGRVESFLERRAELLQRVQLLAESLRVAGDYGYTCDSAQVLFVAHVRVRWDAYRRRHLAAEAKPSAADLVAAFPFTAFFDSLLGRPLFAADSLSAAADTAAAADHVIELATGCFGYLEDMFGELRELQPFELLPGARDRANYLLTNQARIVAMTCTHAAMNRDELLRLGFRYDNVVIEEAAQILDVETLIPLCLQGSGNSAAAERLKRLILIGDHNQLPPVVKHTAVREYGLLDQSFFARMVRLGVPYVELNRQARARPEIADLYRARYDRLGDLDARVRVGAYTRPNAGLAFTYQFVNVEDFQGQGQSEPSRHFYQNLGEAEYLVQVFQYLRLLGHPAGSIAILTTYNGQRALLNDVLKRRCRSNAAFFGCPRAIATVDQYQGQQSDIVLLSLVRTMSVGYLRDLRRLTVALSRARLGLYVFGRRCVFESCFELKDAFAGLLANGDCLELCPGERYDEPPEDGSERKVRRIKDVEDMAALVLEMVETTQLPQGDSAVPQEGMEEATDNDEMEED
ncbi:hypothetical protein LPJ53_002250 [Coemansia erecta]|uniref:P-loop containing nucleoside triphosphate hydrolase protein n=1 Tax=Coemansia erecta TaxID=147472 RepID=A0A9W8CT75_9FUNG|nr:hypothetical protein LPJ53_002250 [Coemansia erecta]